MPAPRNTEASRPYRQPEFLIPWEPRARTLWANLRVLFVRTPGAAGLPPQLRLVREAWFTPHFPTRPLLASLSLHLLVVCLPLPRFSHAKPPVAPASQKHYELTWVGRSDLLPPIHPLGPEKKKISPGGKPKQPLPPPAEDVFARQRILSFPERPNNSQMTLHQPDLLAPQVVKPKPLPNIVLWARTPLPPAPRVELAVRKIPAARLTFPSPKHVEPPANQEPTVAPVNISSRAVDILRPRLVVPPSRTAAAVLPGDAAEAPAVNLPAGQGSADRLQRIIALSPSPAPVAPVVEVPPGNLAAQFSMGPLGGRSGSPGGVANGMPGAQGGANGGPGGEASGAAAAGGPAVIQAPEISVSATPEAPPGLMAGATGPAGDVRPPGLTPGHATAPAKIERRKIARASLPARTIPGIEGMKPPALEQSILRGKKVYTLSINMPNLASRSGSWVLHFSELEAGSEANGGNGESSLLTGPVALLKIDPRYSPEAIREKVEGQVILYAIIRRDGKVEGVHVVRGLDARLDQNAVEAFRRWQFSPARKAGVPVDLEAVVYIPFRLGELF